MKVILEKALSHKYVMPNMEAILNSKVLTFGNRSLDKFLKNSFPFSFVSIKKESACRSHSSSCQHYMFRASQMAIIMCFVTQR
jgi:hypothetical protein